MCFCFKGYDQQYCSVFITAHVASLYHLTNCFVFPILCFCFYAGVSQQSRSKFPYTAFQHPPFFIQDKWKQIVYSRDKLLHPAWCCDYQQEAEMCVCVMIAEKFKSLTDEYFICDICFLMFREEMYCTTEKTSQLYLLNVGL